MTTTAPEGRQDTGASHIAELDGVRGIAVLSILLLHFYDPVAAAQPFGRIVANSTVLLSGGVDLFFVLSGFLITRILVHSKDSANYFRAFYARRTLRIFPLYFTTVAVFFLLLLPLAHRRGLDLKLNGHFVPVYLLFAQNWMQALRINDGAQLAHFWTLAIEEQFYLVWPAVVWCLQPVAIRRAAVATIVFVEAFRIVLWFKHADPLFLYFNTVTRLDAFALGAVLCLSPLLVRAFSQAAPLLIPVGLLLGYFAGIHLLPLCLLIVCGAVISLAASRRGRILRSHFLRTFGKYSFSLYVFHYLVHGMGAHLAPRFDPRVFVLLSVVGGTAFTFALSWLSWRLLEAPALKLKRFFRYEHPGRAAPKGFGADAA